MTTPANDRYGMVSAAPGSIADHAYERGLRDAWGLVDRAVRPLGHGPGQGSNSPWNAGYEQAKREAQAAIWKAIQAEMLKRGVS